MQEKNRTIESILLGALHLLWAVFCALAIMLLMSIPGGWLCLLLAEVPHITTYAWLKVPLLLAAGYIAGGIFARACKLRGVYCGLLSAGLLSAALFLLRGIFGISQGGMGITILLLTVSAVTGSVVSACRRT